MEWTDRATGMEDLEKVGKEGEVFCWDDQHYLGFLKRKKMFPDTLQLCLRPEIWSRCPSSTVPFHFFLNIALRNKDVILELQKQNCFNATEKQMLSLPCKGPARIV